MDTCIECGANVRPSEAVCASCLSSHAEAARTQDPRGCDSGRKIEAPLDDDDWHFENGY